MNGLGRSVSGLMIGAGRAIGLLAPGAWIGVLTGGFLGLAIATFLANTVSGVIAALIVMRHSLKDIDQKSAYQPDCYDSE